MERITLSQRITHRYRDGWDYLDQWSDVGTAKLTPAVRTRDGNDLDDAGEFVRFATIPAGQDRAASIKGLRDALSYSRCRCEHDCCGCTSVHASVTPISSRRFHIRLTASRNY